MFDPDKLGVGCADRLSISLRDKTLLFSAAQASYVRRSPPTIATRTSLVKDRPVRRPGSPARPRLHAVLPQPNQDKANQLNALAATTFDEGTAANDTADKYVRDTVLFASVLFLVAIAQRFKAIQARVAIGVIAVGVLTFVAISLVQLPRL